MRKIYLDNIRYFTVVLVLIYHVCYIFNGAGVYGGLGTQWSVKTFDTILYFVYPWLMVLLFLISGVSARYSLQKRTPKAFLHERTIKLLIPSTAGLFVFHWITGYLNVWSGGSLAYLPVIMIYPVSVLSGIGPLWYIQTLFLFSVLIVLLKKIDVRDRLWTLGGKASFSVLLCLVFLVWLSSQLLNTPVITTYRFGIYGTAFLYSPMMKFRQRWKSTPFHYWRQPLCLVYVMSFIIMAKTIHQTNACRVFSQMDTCG